MVLIGVRWRIGTGEEINIMGQPWLLDDDNPFITIVSQSIENNNVTSLMCVDRRDWNVEVIRDIFNERDQEYILDILLKEDSCTDTIFWNLEDTWVYSVKSVYKMLQAQKGV